MDILLNPKLKGFQCIRCGRSEPVGDYFEGCPTCISQGFPASMAAIYDSDTPFGHSIPLFSPYSLGEGQTPVLALPELAAALGVAGLWVKAESRNPNGSHKDRMSTLIVARAKMLGKPRVVATSSGNAGVSLAAYTARAGLKCSIVVRAGSPGNWARAIRDFGAELITAENLSQRWRLQRRLVHEEGDYPATNHLSPPVGSNPYGVQGYKTIAYELMVQMAAEMPSAVLVPTCRGDLLWGVWQGFHEAVLHGKIHATPRMVAVEPFSRLSQILKGADYRGHFDGKTKQVSVGGYDATYQSLQAIQKSEGTAVDVGDAEAAAAQKRLRKQGIALEHCSAAPLQAIGKLRQQGWLTKTDRVLFIGTGSGVYEA